ncbi:MAG TPA: hypothetical protein VIS07_20420 [Candidatus Binatia bacterium]
MPDRARATLRALAALVGGALLLAASAARADLPPPPTEPLIGPFNFCYQSVEIFRSLKHGDFDFCRLRLRYTPGRAECLRIIISSCNLVVPGHRSRGVPGGLDGFAERIICPPGPPPPTCPSGYW